MPFQKGRAKTGGRKKGTPNKSPTRVVAFREFATTLVNDPEYQASVRKRALAGKLAPGVETYLQQLEAGKPRESLDITGLLEHRQIVVVLPGEQPHQEPTAAPQTTIDVTSESTPQNGHGVHQAAVAAFLAGKEDDDGQ